MHEFIELNGFDAGEEILSHGPRKVLLRAKMAEAYERGDMRTLEDLRREYGGQPRTAADAPARTPARVEPARARRPELEIEGYLSTYNTLVGSKTPDGHRSWAVLQPGCYDGWLAAFEPEDLPFHVEHDDATYGRWVDLEADDVGLRGVVEAEDTCVGRELLQAADEGRFSGFSVRADAMRLRERARLGPGGLVVADWVEAVVREASLVTSAAVEGATVALVSGRKPTFLRALDAMKRGERLRAMWSRPVR